MNLQMEKEQGEVLTVKMKQKVQDFMSGYRMDCKSIDLDAVCAAFIDEMTAGLTDQGSSLAMIPTYIRMDSVVPRNEKVIVIDAGGSICALPWSGLMIRKSR